MDVKEAVFTKEQIISSCKFRQYKDLLTATLQEKQYTETEIKHIINSFMKGKVI